MAWMTPLRRLDVGRDDVAVVDLEAAATAVTLICTSSPSTVVAEVSLAACAAVDLARDDVVEQHLLEQRRVGGERVERRLRHLRERLVGRREDRERPVMRERVRKARLLDEAHQRVEVAGGDRRLHDVLAVVVAVARVPDVRAGRRSGRQREHADEHERPQQSKWSHSRSLPVLDSGQRTA